MTKPISVDTTVNIVELRDSPAAVMEAARIAPVAVTDDKGTAAYVVAADMFEAMLEALEDVELSEIVRSRSGGPTRKVTLDEL